MTISVLLRLVGGTTTNGRVAGHAEIVETGETVVFRDQEEMLAFLQRATGQHTHDEGGRDERAADHDGS
jgi:hypothetical protein